MSLHHLLRWIKLDKIASTNSHFNKLLPSEAHLRFLGGFKSPSHIILRGSRGICP